MTNIAEYEFKVRRVGSSFAMTLPAAWARAQKLNAGDKLTLTVHPDGSVILQAAKWKGGRRTPITGRDGQKVEPTGGNA